MAPVLVGLDRADAIVDLARTLRKKLPIGSLEDAEEAVGDSIVYLLEKGEETQVDFSLPAGGLVLHTARWRLMRIVADRRHVSLDALPAGGRTVGEAESVTAPDQPYVEVPPGGEAIVAAFIAFAEAEGRPPTCKDCRFRDDLPARTAVVAMFGTHNRALAAAGFPPTMEHRPDWTRESAIDAIRGWVRTHGRWPIWSDYRDDPALPASSSTNRLLGTTSARKIQALLDA